MQCWGMDMFEGGVKVIMWIIWEVKKSGASDGAGDKKSYLPKSYPPPPSINNDDPLILTSYIW